MSESTNDTNLIINYLPQTMTDTQFQNLFDSIGPTQSCRIIRDKNTGYSFGYGFVEYKDSRHAKLAISTLNGYKIQHKTLKVSFSRSGENIKNSNLYVNNLPEDVDEIQLENMFKQCGNVIQCRILKDSAGISKGCGFIRYGLHDEAQSAISKFNSKFFPGSSQELSVKFTNDNDKKQKEFMQKFAKIKSITEATYPYSGNAKSLIDMGLPDFYANPMIPDAPVAAIMGYGYPTPDYYMKYSTKQRYGGKMPKFKAAPAHIPPGYEPPHPSFMMYGMTTGYPPNPYYEATSPEDYDAYTGPGSGYYNATSLNHSNLANNGLGHPIMSLASKRTGKIKTIGSKTYNNGSSNVQKTIYQPGNLNKSHPLPGSNLFVYNVGPKTTDKELINLFWPYGTVVKVDIPKDPKSVVGDNRGYGFVSMSTPDEANLAIQYLNNFTFKDKPLQVSIKKD